MHNEKLAAGILWKLKEIFPKSTSSDDLHEFLLPGFGDIPKEDWLIAIDALLQLGFVAGEAAREGSRLRYVTGLSLSARGHEHLKQASIDDGENTASKLVFLSHAAKDQDLALQVKQILE